MFHQSLNSNYLKFRHRTSEFTDKVASCYVSQNCERFTAGFVAGALWCCHGNALLISFVICELVCWRTVGVITMIT